MSDRQTAALVERSRHVGVRPSIADALQQAMVAATSAWSVEEVVGRVLDACCQGLSCPHAGLITLDRRGELLVGRLVLSPRSSEALHLGTRAIPWSTDIVRQLDMVDSPLVQVYIEERPRIVTHFSDLMWRPLPAEIADALQEALDLGPVALLPVFARGRCLGIMAIASSPEHPVTEADLPVLALFASQTAIAIENAQLRHDLCERDRQVSLLLKATIDAQEEERERICLELHDGVAQTLAPAFYYLQTLDGQAELPDHLRANVHKAATLVRNAIREAREVIATLRPAALDRLGLVPTLRQELEEMGSRVGLRVDFVANQARFPKEIETALYRIVREAATNVTKHARATRVAVRVKLEAALDQVVVEVEDDGVGFDPQTLERQVHPKGVGLLSMRKRTELLQGRFAVVSHPGAGTLVRVEVPLLTGNARDDELARRAG